MELKHPKEMVEEKPDKPAYIMASTGEVVTRLQAEQRANQCARMLRSLGLKPGDHISIFMENNRQFLEICLAAGRIGLFYTAISTHLTLSEVKYIINNSGAKAFFTSTAMKSVASELIGKIPEKVARFMVGGLKEGFESYEEKVRWFPVEPLADPVTGRDMLYSSGTTGRPKGVKTQLEDIPYGELPPSTLGLILLFGFHEEAVYLSPAPLYHAAPLRFVLMTIRCGGTAVIMDRFDALSSLELIAQYKVTHSQWVPTMFIRMLRLPEAVRNRYDLSSHQVAIHAAAPIAVQVKQQMIDWWGPVLVEYYAGTEGNGLCAVNSQDWLAHKGTVGRPIIGVPHILDEEGNELPEGEIGTIYFSDGRDFEYHNDPEKTAASRNEKGWTTLNDVGYLDEEGYLYLTDRKTNMIISGGVNIYPQEAENILITHPKVLDAAVLGIPHEEFGEEVKGVVQPGNLAEAGPELEAELIAYCQQHLSKIKCPTSIDFEKELPRTPTGKLLKRLLRERYWKGHEKMI
jgi:acyl-CoA synthetase (AMP-forming)/AMP-acid ligase II